MPPQIRALVFARYRGFRDEQRAELRRLNLVYGENNAGKSAFTRLPALIAASRTPGRPGLELGAAVRGAGFREVQWRGPLPSDEDPDLTLGLDLEDGSEWRWTLQWRDVAATSAIQRFALRHDEALVELEGAQASQTAFDGLVPQHREALIDAHRGALARALDGVIWLEAKREAPTREGTARGAPGTFTSKGEGAAARVAADPTLRRAVSGWFRDHLGYSVEVEALGSDRHRLVLQPSGASYAVPFPDAGEGVQQVFPVVAALEHLRSDGGLLCVEEPESHLHPRLQRALAELIVDVLLQQPSASVLLETHSEVFVLAALKAAAEGLRDAVHLSWVETAADGAATLEEIPLDAEGRPTTARLSQAFDVMGVMHRELIQARKSRRGGG